MSCFGWCTGVAAREAQLGEGVEHKEIDGVGVGSSLNFLYTPSGSSSSSSLSWSVHSSFLASSSRNVRSSEEAQGARKLPRIDGTPYSRLLVASVLSPFNVK